MRFLINFLLFYFLIAALPVSAQKDTRLKSPDGNIHFSFNVLKKAPVYRVTYKGKTMIKDSELSLDFKNGDHFGENLILSKPDFKDIDETYDLIVGKASKVHNQYREAIIPLRERRGAKRQINLVVRAFNEGIAFRYEFPKQESWTSYELVDENTSFNITQDPRVYTLLFDSYTNSHEGDYHQLALSEIKPDLLLDMPALFEFPDNIYMAITEANLRDYAGMYLSKKEGILHSQLSPLPGQTETKVKAGLPHQTPWRVIMISDRIGAFIESNMLTNLNEPTKIKDLSWINPGKTTFHWWNGDIAPDTTFAPGINFETNKYYIDFCARNNIEYHAVIGYGGVAWYQHEGDGYADAWPQSGIIKPFQGLDMQQICNYAKEQGVGIHVWVNWKAIYPKLEENFTQFEEWGINGMMVDFMDRDDQEMVNIQEEILRKAADHKLYIQFHGSFKPTGLHRTYPNEFTREGSLNYEVNKWRKKGLSPDHDIIIPFTRLLAGATDYHLGGFRAVPEAAFKTQYTRPLMVGTRCHMLAMYVVLESYLGSLCDYPASYEDQPGFDFLTEIPTIWDETKVLNADVGKYITIARRKGDHWYVGSLNNTESRTIQVSMDFLPQGNYTAELYSDAPDAAQNPNNLIRQTTTVSKTDVFSLKLASGGGQVMRLIRQ